MTIENNVTTRLNPVFAFHGYTCQFPEEEGWYQCEVQVKEGTVEFLHGAYNLQTGMWDEVPEGEVQKILVHENETVKFNFHYGKHDGQADQIAISNHSYLKPASFVCRYRKCAQMGMAA